MKTFFKVFCFVLICSVVVTDSYAESYLLRGELYCYCENGQDKWTRGIRSGVISDVPVIIKQGKHIVSLVFNVESPPSNKYSLTVSLLTNPKSTDGFSTTVLEQTFASSLVGGQNGPLEFDIDQSGIKIGGALGVSIIH